MTRSTELAPPVLGRPSTAAAAPAVLRERGESAGAAYRADGGDSPWCALRAASVSGVRHRLAGIAGEDSFAWVALDGVVAAAVCDGLGSVPGSGATAARTAVTAAAAARSEASDRSEDSDDSAAVAAAIRAANQAARGGGATTLVVALIREDGPIAVGRVGDSTAFVVARTGAARELFQPPDDGEVATGTDALPADDPVVELARADLEPGMVIVLATDGAAGPWRDGPTTVAPAFVETLTGAPTPLELLHLTDFSRQGCHDDRTVVALWRHSDPDERPARIEPRPAADS